jgi:hypothetical protein
MPDNTNTVGIDACGHFPRGTTEEVIEQTAEIRYTGSNPLLDAPLALCGRVIACGDSSRQRCGILEGVTGMVHSHDNIPMARKMRTEKR